MSIPIIPVSSHCQRPAIGIIAELILIDADDVQGITDPVFTPGIPHKILAGDVSLTENPRAYRMIFRPKECTFRQSARRTPNGTAYETEINFRLVRPDNITLNWLRSHDNGHFVALWRLITGEMYLDGTREMPFHYEFGWAQAALHDVNVSLKNTALHPAWEIETFDLELLTNAEFDMAYTLAYTA